MSWSFEQGFVGQAPTMDPGYTYNVGGEQISTHPPQAYTNYNVVNVNGDVWVFSTNSRMIEVTVYNTWDSANEDYEKLTYPYYFDKHYGFQIAKIYERHPSGLPEDEFAEPYDYNHTIGAVLEPGSPVIYVTQWYDKLYVLRSNTILKWDIETRAYEGIVTVIPPVQIGEYIDCSGTCPDLESQVAGSNLCAANGKLFLTSVNLTNAEQQRVFMYDIAANTWVHNIIPGKHQTSERFIVDGLDGFVWVTSKNNHAVVKVSAETGLPTASVRIHRHPYAMHVNQSKEVYVAGDYNVRLVSLLNQSTGASASFCTGASVINRFFDSGGYMWFLQEDDPVVAASTTPPTPVSRFARVRKSDLHATIDSDGYKSGDGEIVDIPAGAKLDTNMGNIMSGVITKALSYERFENGGFVTYNVKPYVFIISKTGAIKAFRCSALVRPNKYITRGTAMIAVGAQAYYGD